MAQDNQAALEAVFRLRSAELVGGEFAAKNLAGEFAAEAANLPESELRSFADSVLARPTYSAFLLPIPPPPPTPAPGTVEHSAQQFKSQFTQLAFGLGAGSAKTWADAQPPAPPPAPGPIGPTPEEFASARQLHQAVADHVARSRNPMLTGLPRNTTPPPKSTPRGGSFGNVSY